MNTDLLLAIADAIELNAEKFNMDRFIYASRGTSPQDEESFFVRCDTTACVAGWAAILTGSLSEEGADFVDTTLGARLLDLDYDDAWNLFHCDEDTVWFNHAEEYDWDQEQLLDGKWDLIKGHDAAHLLRRIARGEVTL